MIFRTLLPVAIAIAAAVPLTLLFARRDYRLSLRWGAVWGTALGCWFVAPVLLNVHQLRPATPGEWAVIDAFLVISFAAWGMVLGPVAALLFAGYVFARRPRVINLTWAYAVWTLALLPGAYLAVSAVIELAAFSKPSEAAGYSAALRLSVLSLVTPVAGFVALYRRRVRAGWDPSGRTLVFAAAAATLCGLAVLPARLTTRSPVESAAVPLARSRQDAPKPAPLFVLCLDGANWRTLRPLMERGLAPTLARIAATGLHGRVEAPWPPYWSNPAWAAIFTGYTYDEVGVHEDLAATAPGLSTFELSMAVDPVLNPIFAEEFGLSKINVIRPMLAPRSALKRPPIWERLSRAGVHTAVVRLPFSYPAPGQADYVFSNWLVPDLWDMANVQSGDRDKLVFPASKTDEVVSNFSDAVNPPPQLFVQMLPETHWPQPADSLVDPVQVLNRIVTNNFRETRITKWLVNSDRTLSVVMLYMPGIDLMSHAFWQYRFPDDFPDSPPAPADVAHLGPVLDRYVSLLDSEIAEMIASFPEPPNVLIVSDHGEGPTQMATLWKGWHASPGVFIAAGPDISQRPEELDVSYYDIVPTILDLQRFETPAGLSGRSLLGGRKPN